MSLYVLQKLIREINREPLLRERFMAAPDELVSQWDLSDVEKAALIARDYGALYRMGVHGLLLRPFSIIHQVSESEYLRLIRAEEDR